MTIGRHLSLFRITITTDSVNIAIISMSHTEVKVVIDCHKPTFHMYWLILASWKVPTPIVSFFHFPGCEIFFTLVIAPSFCCVIHIGHKSYHLNLECFWFIVILVCSYWFSEIPELMRERVEIVVRMSCPNFLLVQKNVCNVIAPLILFINRFVISF